MNEPVVLTACDTSMLVMFKFLSNDAQFRARLFNAILGGQCPDFACSLGSSGAKHSYTALWRPEHAEAVRTWVRSTGIAVTGILQSTMLVPDRDGAPVCPGCHRAHPDRPIIIQNALPAMNDDTPRELVIRQRVLGHYQHEALESIVVGGHRAFDPHEERWYLNLVADWRLNR